MAGLNDKALLNPSSSNFVSIWGKKGSGKSALARLLWWTYPFDRLVIDPTGDVKLPDTEDLHEPLPLRWPGAVDDKRTSYRFVPDPGAATYIEDMDKAVGLAFQHRRCMLWCDEIHELTRANKTPSWTRRALNQGRHRDLTLLLCGPRPVNVDPLILFQSDIVYIFELPNRDDRERIADSIGWDRDELHAGVLGLPPHGYLRFDGRATDPAERLVEFPPLPRKIITKIAA